MMIKSWLRKIFVFVFLLVMVLAVVSCGRDSDEAEAYEMLFPAQGTVDAPPAPQSAMAPTDETMDLEEGIELDWALEAVDDTGPTEDALPPETYVPIASQAPNHLGVDVMQRMIIRSSSMSINTLYYQDTTTDIETIVENRGGFIESSRQWMVSCRDAGMLWRAEYVIRVPVGLFDTTNNELMALGQVQYFSTASRDATHEFNDLGSRLQIREAEEVRVQRMLEEATELEDIIRLEAQLTNLRLIIDAYRRRREEIDQLATFSTIGLSVYEVIELPEIEEEEEEEYYVLVYGFGDRISGAFNSSVNFMARALEEIGVFLALIILPVGLIGLVVGGIYFVIKGVSGRKLFRWGRSGS